MTRDDLFDVLMGAAVVLAGFAVYRHYQAKKEAAAAPAQPVPYGIGHLLDGAYEPAVLNGIAPGEFY